MCVHVTLIAPFDRRSRTANRSSKHVFPTPESPISKSLSRWSLGKKRFMYLGRAAEVGKIIRMHKQNFHVAILIFPTVGREEEESLQYPLMYFAYAS